MASTNQNIISTDTQPTSTKNQLPLQYVWTLFYISPKMKSDWVPIHVSTFSTVTQFWSVFNHMAVPTQLPVLTSLFVVKKGVEPRWEHPSNAKGGRIVINLSIAQHEIIDDVWLHTLMALIGEYFSASDSINVCTCNVKTNAVRIALWVKDASDTTAINSIIHEWASNLKISPSKLNFTAFEQADQQSVSAPTNPSPSQHPQQNPIPASNDNTTS